MSDFSALSTAEIVAKYNEVSGESVKRFASRSIAEARLAKAIADAEAADAANGSEIFAVRLAKTLAEAAERDTERNDELAPEAERAPVEAVPESAGDGVTPGSAETAISAPSSAIEGSEATSVQVEGDLAVIEAAPSVSRQVSEAPKKTGSRERGVNLDPKKTLVPARYGSKQAILIDLLARKNGATLKELTDALAAAGGKPWTAESVKTGLRWDVNFVKGYGIATEFTSDPEVLRAEGRNEEAAILAAIPKEARNPLAVFVLVYPSGVTKPLPHVKSKSLLAEEEKAKAPKVAKKDAAKVD